MFINYINIIIKPQYNTYIIFIGSYLFSTVPYWSTSWRNVSVFDKRLVGWRRRSRRRSTPSCCIGISHLRKLSEITVLAMDIEFVEFEKHFVTFPAEIRLVAALRLRSLKFLKRNHQLQVEKKTNVGPNKVPYGTTNASISNFNTNT